ncbi:MAG: translation initiation factor IF-2 [Candidatus Hydrogenedentota bacterium]|mgnify:CR=1 FL=1
MRIYELSKQLNVSNKEVLDKLPELGIVVKSHASSLSPDEVKAVIKLFKPDAFEMKKVEPAPVAPAPAPQPVASQPASPTQASGAPRPGAPQAAPAPAHQPRRGSRFNQRRRGRPAIPEPASVTESATTPAEERPAEKPVILLREGITVKELADKMSLPAPNVIKTLLKMGVMASINQRIALDVAELAATEFGFKSKSEELYKASELKEAATSASGEAQPRPPIVTIMGHVDHGKTKLLDYIRKANVVAGEAGGITQHIGAYTVETPGGRITFIDTPGHEAFTAMRARGASVTDIVVLVVAADDGIMPQTEEAIHHAQAANVAIIVAINKCDLPAANIDKVKQQLSERNLSSEDWGGTTITVPVSAKAGTNVDKLLEMILLQAEIMELKAPADAPARGVVIEANLDKAKGPVATVLVRTGTLSVGDTFVCGTASGKVRALFASDGSRLTDAGPSTPAVVLGCNDVPAVGDILQETEDEKEARAIATERAQLRRADIQQKSVRVSLDDLNRAGDEEAKELAIVFKADAQGSVEAIRDVVERITDVRVRLRLLHAGVGAINDTDVNLAAASNALIIAFNVRSIGSAEDLARRLGVEIRSYDIIYKLVDDIKLALQGLLAPKVTELVIGHAEVRNTFRISKIGMIAGSYIRDGQIKRNAGVRLVRDGKIIYTGKIASLKRFKDDVREVGVNFECGIGIENFNDVKVGDVIEAYTTQEEMATL